MLYFNPEYTWCNLQANVGICCSVLWLLNDSNSAVCTIIFGLYFMLEYSICYYCRVSASQLDYLADCTISVEGVYLSVGHTEGSCQSSGLCNRVAMETRLDFSVAGTLRHYPTAWLLDQGSCHVRWRLSLCSQIPGVCYILFVMRTPWIHVRILFEKQNKIIRIILCRAKFMLHARHIEYALTKQQN